MIALVAIGAYAACGPVAVDDIGPGAYRGPTSPMPGSDAGAASVDAGSQPGVDGSIAPPPTSDGGASTDGGLPPVSPHAQALFEALLPQLDTACGGACHSQAKGSAPAWMGPPDPYTSARGYKGIVVSDPGTSIILNKGRHEGPSLDDPLRSLVVAWLTAEASSVTATTLPSTAPFAVTTGANTVDISKGGTGVTGATMTFTAALSADVLELSNIQIKAPATTGVHVVFPIFVVMPSQGAEVDDTSFSNADQTIAAGQSVALAPGRLLLTGWAATNQMRIEFTKLQAVSTPDGGTIGGCKSVTSFTANAVPAIQQNTCLTCHNTGGSGNGALDLSALAATPRDDARACAQALSRITPQTPAQSDIILAPTGGVAAHPFKNAAATYSQMMQQWIVNEK